MALTLCIAPATAARLLSARIARVLVLAAGLGAAAGLVGLLVSFHMGLPTGPVVGVLAVAEVAALDAEAAATIAATLQALATPSRLLILTRLRRGPCAVGELAEAVGMEPSAVSHQLRLLRALGLVAGARNGKRVVYSLYDNHVAQLLDEAVYHIDHLRLGKRDQPPDSVVTEP